ncbi:MULTISPECIES: DUF935 family protein [unclassified Neisseria]|uniref:phage portal protein family protein n=1 Tax=unclassified Neisseria TaxID=2623750 RepID=UPI001D16131C|nr:MULTISPECIES: DUF935 family protein [unclassified Neisseria]
MNKPHFKLKTAAGTVAAKPENLTAHLAVIHRFFGAGGFGGLLPNPDTVLKKLGRNIAVYRELSGDAIVAGHCRRRKAAVTSMKWRLEDEGVPPETLRSLIDGFMNSIDLYQLINNILDAALFGYQPVEVVWAAGNYWLPEKIIAKPQEWFAFDSDGRLYFTAGGGFDKREPVPEYKFLCPTHNAGYTNPYGTGDLSCVYWPTVFKRGGLKFWAEFAEKFGAPWIIGREPRSNTDADTDKLIDRLTAAYPDMDDKALQNELARLIFLSGLVGRIEAAQEMGR